MRNKFFKGKKQKEAAPFTSEQSKHFRNDASEDSEAELKEVDFVNLPPAIVTKLLSNEEYRNKVPPYKKEKKAFKSFLDESLGAALSHDLKALKYLAKLLVEDRQVASQYGLFNKLADILTTLRLAHMKYIDSLVDVVKNEKGIYNAEVQTVAQKRLDEFLMEGEGYARSILHDNPNYKKDAFFKSSKALNAFELIFDEINSNYASKVKPQEFKDIQMVLSVFANHDREVIDPYRAIIANHILPNIKDTLLDFPDAKPRLPQSKSNAHKYLGMLCSEPKVLLFQSPQDDSSDMQSFEAEEDDADKNSFK